MRSWMNNKNNYSGKMWIQNTIPFSSKITLTNYLKILCQHNWVRTQILNLNLYFEYLLFFKLSTAPGDTEAIDVWFVMLDRAKISQMYDVQSKKYSSKRILSISEAYRNLAQLISQRDIPLKLPLTKEREVVNI